MNRHLPAPATEPLFLIALLVPIAFLLAYMPVVQAIALFGTACGAFLLLRHAWLIWLVLGATLPVAAGVEIGRASLADLLVALAVGLWLVDGVRRRSLRTVHSSLLGLVIVWVSAQSISLLGAANLVEGVAEVVKWVEFAVILAIAPTMLSARETRWVVGGLLVAGTVQAVLGLYQFVNQIGPEWFIIMGRFMRASGVFGQPNPFAGYLGLSLPVAVSLAIWAWGRSWRAIHPGFSMSPGQHQSPQRDSEASRESIDKPLRLRQRLRHLLPALFYSVASLLIALGLLASWSRGGWLGAAAGLVVIIALRSRAALATAGVASLALLVGLLFGSVRPALVPAPVVTRFADLPAYLGLTDVLSEPVTDENFSVIERIAHWVAALRMWEQAPWIGIGPGNYATVYPAVRLPRWEDPLGHAHNVYLNVLAETGVVGLTAYLLLTGGAILWTWHCFRGARSGSYERALAIGVLGVLAHLAVHNLFDNLYVQGIYLHLALLFAALLSIQPAERLAQNQAVDRTRLVDAKRATHGSPL